MAMALNSMPLKSVVVLITVRTADRAVRFAHKLNRALRIPPRFAIPFCPPQHSLLARGRFFAFTLSHTVASLQHLTYRYISRPR